MAYAARRLLGLSSLLAIIATTHALPSPQTQLPLSTSSDRAPLPLLIWHGLGDRFDADGLQSVGQLAEQIHPGTEVYYIRTAETGSKDRTNSFFGNVSQQIDEICETIATDPTLLSLSRTLHNPNPNSPAKPLIYADALGFSQGGQFLRGLLERCEALSLRSLVTFGSQHNGIAQFQNCSAFDFVCRGATALIGNNVWTDTVQSSVVPAQYFREVNSTTGLAAEDYLIHSHFLADINNERQLKNARYAERVAELDRFVMYVFEDDKTVIPKESGWFAEVNATSGQVTPLRERALYKEDWIGLKELDGNGGLVFRVTPGGHMALDEAVLTEAFTEFFGPVRESSSSSSAPYAQNTGGSPCREIESSTESWLDWLSPLSRLWRLRARGEVDGMHEYL